MGEFVIEKGVPVPNNVRKEYARYPFPEMEIGDSFSFPEENISTVRHAAHSHASRKNKKFIVRKLDQETGRVWRVK